MNMLKAIFKQFLSDDKGDLSTTRLITIVVITIIMSLWIALNIVSLIHNVKAGLPVAMVDFQPMTVGIVLTVITGKVVQSFAENGASNDSGQSE
jgi:hypothetical protein